MMKRYLPTVLTTLLCYFLCTSVRAQTVIATMDFDGTTPEITVSPDVPFFDDGADGFFGIYDANNDNTDGTPADTGDGNNNGYPEITSSAMTGDYLLVEDLDNTDGNDTGTPVAGTTGVATVTFGPIDITGQTGVAFTFDYQVVGFANTEKAAYELFVDGVGQGEVNLREGLSGGASITGSVSECVLDGSASISLELRIKQNGDDQAAFDNFVVTANSGCTPICGVSIAANQLSLVCDAFTEGGNDAVSGSVNYLGIEPGVSVSIDGGATITGDSDDPATMAGGTQNNAREIRFTGLTEGGTYTITIAGGNCSEGREPTFTFTVPASLCQPIGDIVINEFLARLTSGSPGEFVEIYNRGTETVDVSGYTIEDGSGARNVVPAGTMLGPDEGLVFGDAPTSNGGCILLVVFGLSLNDDGDVIILRNASQSIVHQVAYDGSDLTPGVSRALSPDGNIEGGYQNHTDVSAVGNPYSPCSENIDNTIALPVELLHFSAQKRDKSTALSWSTAREENNDYFLVDRSLDGNEWVEIGKVKAGDQSANDYELNDLSPANGVNYYRLRQLDLDGTMTVHGVVSVLFSTAGFSLYPNPATTEIRFTTAPAPDTRISLLSADGRLLREIPAANGGALIGDLSPGLYLLRVEQNDGVATLRFIKQ